MRSGMKADELAKVEDALTARNDDVTTGLINVNTAPEAVLNCLPGLTGTTYPAALIAHRRNKTADDLKSIAWVTDVLKQDAAAQVGPYLTTRSYQFSADVVAVGHGRRAMRRDFM